MGWCFRMFFGRNGHVSEERFIEEAAPRSRKATRRPRPGTGGEVVSMPAQVLGELGEPKRAGVECSTGGGLTILNLRWGRRWCSSRTTTACGGHRLYGGREQNLLSPQQGRVDAARDQGTEHEGRDPPAPRSSTPLPIRSTRSPRRSILRRGFLREHRAANGIRKRTSAAVRRRAHHARVRGVEPELVTHHAAR